MELFIDIFAEMH